MKNTGTPHEMSKLGPHVENLWTSRIVVNIRLLMFQIQLLCPSQARQNVKIRLTARPKNYPGLELNNGDTVLYNPYESYTAI